MILTVFMILVWVGIATVADMCFKAAKDWTDVSFFLGVALYALTGGIALMTYRRVEFGAVVVIWIATSLLVGIAVSALWYHEALSPCRVAAVILTLAALILETRSV